MLQNTQNMIDNKPLISIFMHYTNSKKVLWFWLCLVGRDITQFEKILGCLSQGRTASPGCLSESGDKGLRLSLWELCRMIRWLVSKPNVKLLPLLIRLNQYQKHNTTRAPCLSPHHLIPPHHVPNWQLKISLC
jgi:hypothetical protein